MRKSTSFAISCDGINKSFTQDSLPTSPILKAWLKVSLKPSYNLGGEGKICWQIY